MTKELVLASWPNMEEFLFMIFILINRYLINDEDIHFVKGYEYALIGNPYHPYGTSTDHEFFAFMMTCSTES